jgi:hypothetical protein
MTAAVSQKDNYTNCKECLMFIMMLFTVILLVYSKSIKVCLREFTVTLLERSFVKHATPIRGRQEDIDQSEIFLIRSMLGGILQ